MTFLNRTSRIAEPPWLRDFLEKRLNAVYDDDEPTRADKATESNLTKDIKDEDHEDAEVSDLTKDTQPSKDACVVRNMTCARFPSRKHCKGIAVGR